MTDRTPPFTALRALEAAARHKSFTWAARELNITHSAVSQSIKRLETELGARLFERKGGAMQPSDAALKLAQSYSEAAQALGQAIRDISGGADADAIALHVRADLARLWLAPRLVRLGEALADARIELVTTAERAAAVEILFVDRARGDDRLLGQVAVIPVCGPELFPSAALVRPRQVLQQALFAQRRQDWADWTARFAPAAPPPRPHVVDDAGILIDGLLRGSGVALVDSLSVESHLLSGQLVALPFALPDHQTLVLRCGSAEASPDLLRRLAMWIELELARGAALLKGHIRQAPQFR